MIEIGTLGDSDAEEAAWDEHLRKTPGGLVYQSTRYRDLLLDHLKCHAEYLVAEESGEIRGVLPSMWAGTAGARVWNSLPFYGSNGGPVADSPAVEAALIDAWNERVTDQVTLAGTMVGNPFLNHEPPEPVHRLTDERLSQVTQLPASAREHDLLAIVEGSARRNVRKAERSGVEAGLDAGVLPELHRLHRENIEAVGGLAKPESFFSAIPRHLRVGEDFDLWVARLDGSVIAGLLVLYFSDVAEYFTPATAHDHRSDQPLALVLAKAMTHAAERGCRRWNWGGTWVTQEGVFRFKRKWGATQGRYRYFTQINDEALLELSPEQLREQFPGFYVAPFSALQPTGGTQ